ncbi:MAG TPA: SusC/RagA family TonB-linked outer membrane protein, partial [Longimicrobiaceae bacterium]
KLRSQNSVDYAIGNLYYWQAPFTNAVTGFERVPVGEDDRQESYALVSTNTATYTAARGEHNFDVLVGVETNRFRNNALSLQTTGFVSSEYELRRIVALGDQLLKKSGFAGEENRLGYIGRLNYNYADRYLFTATVRRDGVSTFAPGHRWGTFPAFSAGWRISEEPFFHVPWVNELKLRGSWGQLGNSTIPGGQYPQYVSVLLWAEYQIGNQVQLAPTPQGRLANPKLTWETNDTRDIGFESSLFDNHVDLSATWYQRDTRNFLVNVPVPVESGFSSAPINVGSMRNSGLELEAGYRTRIRNALDLRLSGNLTTVKNRLVSLLEGVEQFQQAGFYRTAVGFPVGYFYGYKTCGVYQTDAAAAAVPDRTVGSNQPRAGDLCFQDIDGRDEAGNLTGQPDGQITTDDRTFLGKTIPDAYYGINLGANWRRFDLTAFFNGVIGVQRFNSVRRDLESMTGGGVNQLASTLNRWSPANPNGTMPRAILGDPAQNARLSDRWVEDADFFRLKTLQVGYTLPDNLLGSRTRGTRVYVSATNLFTLTGYSGLDPEFGAAGSNTAYGNFYAVNGSQLQAGTDFGNIPQPRMFQVGVSTTF